MEDLSFDATLAQPCGMRRVKSETPKISTIYGDIDRGCVESKYCVVAQAGRAQRSKSRRPIGSTEAQSGFGIDTVVEFLWSDTLGVESSAIMVRSDAIRCVGWTFVVSGLARECEALTRKCRVVRREAR